MHRERYIYIYIGQGGARLGAEGGWPGQGAERASGGSERVALYQWAAVQNLKETDSLDPRRSLLREETGNVGHHGRMKNTPLF